MVIWIPWNKRNNVVHDTRCRRSDEVREGKFKLNIDAAVDQRLGSVGVDAVIRDCNGHVIDVLTRLIPIFITPFDAELIAIQEALN
ncbi:hypothetical protein PanWU01x14_231220 [Parasponia andersonii]|uniref:RNase H type-1 domain-containing protein n=1 Tax=Parasponia andersonii TaxID=3476 RepID=A0A2P5BKC5_PARAD|nr:hypothetical protein PanWU01x14_231220 [Parasponia andersonii]